MGGWGRTGGGFLPSILIRPPRSGHHSQHQPSTPERGVKVSLRLKTLTPLSGALYLRLREAAPTMGGRMSIEEGNREFEIEAMMLEGGEEGGEEGEEAGE